MIYTVEEKMSEHFTKYHVGNLPRSAVFHRFASLSGEIHDHPFAFFTTIISGGYVERVYTVAPDGSWVSEDIFRAPGTSHRVEATHIHSIIELPEGECWTMILPEEKTREPRFWNFNENGSQSRVWSDGDFN